VVRLPQSLRRPRTWIALVVALVLLVAVVAPYVYIHFIKADPAERLSLDDVTTSTTGGTSSTAGTGVEGAWTATDGSAVQYRVKEVLFGQDSEATGRADRVTGGLVILGTTIEDASFAVDMTAFASDESRRDGQFHDRIMETDTFPTATFELTGPIVLAAVPADREEITATATGDLTMHGVTKEVMFDLTARRDGATIAVNATIPIVFSDYEIDDPSGGPATVGDEGELEVLLVLTAIP
jgi:polyisoprenoid-binding protein YceI